MDSSLSCPHSQNRFCPRVLQIIPLGFPSSVSSCPVQPMVVCLPDVLGASLAIFIAKSLPIFHCTQGSRSSLILKCCPVQKQQQACVLGKIAQGTVFILKDSDCSVGDTHVPSHCLLQKSSLFCTVPPPLCGHLYLSAFVHKSSILDKGTLQPPGLV